MTTTERPPAGLEFKTAAFPAPPGTRSDPATWEGIGAITGVPSASGATFARGAVSRAIGRRMPKGSSGRDWNRRAAVVEQVKELEPGDPRVPAGLPAGAGAVWARLRFILGTEDGRAGLAAARQAAPGAWNLGFAHAKSRLNGAVRTITDLDLYNLWPSSVDGLAVKAAHPVGFEVKSGAPAGQRAASRVRPGLPTDEPGSPVARLVPPVQVFDHAGANVELTAVIVGPLPILRVYVDETGDRGTSGRSSPFFAFAAVLIADEDEPPLRAAVSQLRRDLHVPVGKALHWKDHVKTFSRRQHVAKTLAAVPNLQLVYVVVEKAAIPASAAMRTDQAIFYNFAAAMVLERALLAAREWPGRHQRRAVIRFGHVKGFDHTTTTDYFTLRRQLRDPHWLPWHLLNLPVHFEAQNRWDGLQAADQYAGMLSAAIRPDEFGNHEHHHFLHARPQIREVGGVAWKYGFKLLGNPATLSALPWWSRANI